MLEIVVLDGHALNPGDLDWSGMQAMGHCTFYDRTPPELVLERAEKAEVLIINKVVMTRETLCRLPRLRYIGLTATGYNVIDVKAAAELGITVTNIPAYSTQSVAQMTFALLLELTNRVGEHSQTVMQREWSRSADFCYWKYPLHELCGRKFGIVGYGAIGQAVAKVARAFGMSVVGCRSNNQPGIAEDGTELLPLADLLGQAD
ncbi:MAG: NAD(P)-dependent oxidoreductase, partial [Victivallaceae bacterium]